MAEAQVGGIAGRGASATGTGQRQVAASIVLLALGAIIAAAYSVVAVPLGREFGPSRTVLMLTMTIMALVSGILSPLAGTAMDRWSLRRLFAIGIGFLVAGFLAVSFATSFAQVLAIYGLVIAPANILLSPMATSVLLSRWFVARRGAALGIAATGIALGGLIFPPVIQALLDAYPWRVALRLLALIILVVATPAVALVVSRPADRGLFPDGAGEPPAAGAHAGEKPAPVPILTVLASKTFWVAAISFAVVLSGVKGMVTNLVPLAVDQGIRPSAAALLISIYAGCGFVAKLSFAAVADRVPPLRLLSVGLCGFALGTACMIKAEAGYWVIALGVGLVGTFGGLMVPLQGLLVSRMFGAHVVGRVYGTLSLVLLVALLATPPLFGLSYDLTGTYDTVFVTFTILALAAAALVMTARLEPGR